MEPQAAINLLSGPRRSVSGHLLALGAYVSIFGALAYLTFLRQGGVPGQLLLILASSLPIAIGIETVVLLGRARQKMAAHHVARGCLSAMLFCGIGGIWFAFRDQILLTLVGSLAVVWLTKYSPAASFLRPPGLGDLAGTASGSENRNLGTAVKLAAALALFVVGVGLTLLAAVGQMERPGGLSITI